MTKRLTISKKLSLRIAGSVVFLVILLLFFLNGFLEGVVKDYLGREIERLNRNERYQLTIDDYQLNIYKGNLALIGIATLPREKYTAQFNQGLADEKVLKEIKVTRAEIKGISLFNFLWDKTLNIRGFLVDELTINIYRPGEVVKLQGIEEEKESSFSLDSLRLPGITSVDLSQISVQNYQFNIINKAKQDTLSSYQGDALIISGIALKPAGTDSPVFEIDDSKLALGLTNQAYNLPGGLYSTSFEAFHLSSETGHLFIKNYGLKPIASRDDFSRRNNYTYEIFDVEIKNFDIYGIQIHSLINTGAISLDSISMAGLNLAIYKDKTKPFNISKHKSLPNEQLKEINLPLHAKQMKISNSQLRYSELQPKGGKMLELELDSIEARINYITTVQDSMLVDRPLQIQLSASLQNAIPFSVDLKMPYLSESNSFTFSGSTKATSSFKELNSIVSPALGIRFTAGRLNGMEFNATGNPHKIKGDLALYYQDLEIEVENKNHKEKKGVNWLANTVVKSSNPNKKNMLIIGSMEFEREYHKALPNYLWKSIQSGVVNSFNPVGKRKKRKMKK